MSTMGKYEVWEEELQKEIINWWAKRVYTALGISKELLYDSRKNKEEKVEDVPEKAWSKWLL